MRIDNYFTDVKNFNSQYRERSTQAANMLMAYRCGTLALHETRRFYNFFIVLFLYSAKDCDVLQQLTMVA